MARLINMTPHPIHIVDGEKNIIRTIESSGLVRLAAKTVSAGTIDGVPVSKTEFGEPIGLPMTQYKCDRCESYVSKLFAGCDCEECNGTYTELCYYIVSQLVKSAFPDRADLLVPAEVVRDNNGNIIGCHSLGI